MVFLDRLIVKRLSNRQSFIFFLVLIRIIKVRITNRTCGIKSKKVKKIKTKNGGNLAIFSYPEIFSKLFSTNRLTFLENVRILCGLSSWEQVKNKSQPLKFLRFTERPTKRVLCKTRKHCE